MVLLPVMVPGVGGPVTTVTAKVCDPEDPQELLAATVTLPLLEPAVAIMLSTKDVPVHPVGSVHE